MKFLVVYNQGNVPSDKKDENVEQLWRWIDNLKASGVEINRFIVNDIHEGKSVAAGGASAYAGKVFGISTIEAASMDDALMSLQGWPELEYGGRLDILPELQ